MAEFTAYDARKARGEIGIVAPGGANVPGLDYVTAERLPNGKIWINIADATSRVNKARKFKKVSSSLKQTWKKEIDDAILTDRLFLGDRKLEAQIREAWKKGRWRKVRDTSDFSREGQGKTVLND